VASGRPADGAAARPEQGRERAITPSTHFAEQELWQEFHDHGSSLNRALNEALRIHSGPAWRVFHVRGCPLSLVILPLSFLSRLRLP
jgi:hypothetical protein